MPHPGSFVVSNFKVNPNIQLTTKDFQHKEILQTNVKGYTLRQSLTVLHPTLRKFLGEIRLDGVRVDESDNEITFNKLKRI